MTEQNRPPENDNTPALHDVRPARLNPNAVKTQRRQQKVVSANRRRPRRTRRRFNLLRARWYYVPIFIISILIVFFFGSLVLITDANNQLQESQTSLNRVLDDLNQKPANEWTYADFERLQSSVQEVNGNLDRSQGRIKYLSPFAPLDNDLANTLIAIEASQEITLAVDNMLAGVQPTLFFLTEGQDDATFAQISSGERAVELLALGQGKFGAAEDHLTQAENKIDELNERELSEELVLIVEDLNRYRREVTDINNIFISSSDLLTIVLGLDDTQNYLVLAQNNDELRPSGGFVSTYGWIRVNNSRIVEYDYFPSTETSPNPPPATFANELNAPEWWLNLEQPVYYAWDSSWSADFPVTGQMAIDYYTQGNNATPPYEGDTQLDGVLTIDILGFQYMLEALGAIVVPGYENVITAENFREVVYSVRATGPGNLPHKELLSAVYGEILTQWQNLPQDQKSVFLGAQLRALREKHIMFYSTNPEINAALDILGWGGAQTGGTDHDYLMVVDSNFSANKSNSSIFRRITYDVTIQDDGSLNSRATIAYDYFDDVARKDPAVRPEHYFSIDYFNQIQVFVPLDSELTDSDNLSGSPIIDNNKKHTLYVSSVLVEYNTSERYQYSYTTPVVVTNFGVYSRYRLLLQKQPGTQNDIVSVQITLPKGASLVSADPEPLETFLLEQQVLAFRVELTRDQWIEVVYR